MNEIFTRQSEAGNLELPESGSMAIDSNSLEWQDCSAEGFYIKPLLEDQVTGIRTWLMKVEAGAFSPLHAHEEIEQIYVLEGSFYDQDKTYQAGELIVRVPGAMHTAGSKTGAVVLLFYSK
jgi:anti-sigma factor ChrR (cupin superfamily)